MKISTFDPKTQTEVSFKGSPSMVWIDIAGMKLCLAERDEHHGPVCEIHVQCQLLVHPRAANMIHLSAREL